jgi:hypothetical protein
MVCVSERLIERKVEVSVVGLGGAVGGSVCCGAVRLTCGGGGGRVGVVGVFLLLDFSLFTLFVSLTDMCVRSLTLFWTRFMIWDAGRVWVGGCAGLSGFRSAFGGRTLPIHHVSLTGALFFGLLILQMLQDCSSGLFSSYVQLEQVHVVLGGFALCWRVRHLIFIEIATLLRLCFLVAFAALALQPRQRKVSGRSATSSSREQEMCSQVWHASHWTIGVSSLSVSRSFPQ